MEKDELEKRLNEIHDFLIRLEPICEDVRSLKKWRDGNGIPGARFQLWVIWSLFMLLGAVLIKKA